MKGNHQLPCKELSNLIECYWYVESGEASHVQKIIPDGYPELIFHFRDSYQINISGTWSTQSKSLVAGQIRKYFYLKNNGQSKIFGIKLKPTGLKHIFGISMHPLTDQVMDLHQFDNVLLNQLDHTVRLEAEFYTIVNSVEKYFISLSAHEILLNLTDKAVARIINAKGNIDICEICSSLSISERHLERLFKEFVGLPPKFFARIIRFSNIFSLIENNDPSWSSVVYDSGFYDQSHFIRNFKAFSGDDPSAYLFNEPSLANFLLKRA